VKKFQNLSSALTVVFSFILAFGLVACDSGVTDPLENSDHSQVEVQTSNLMHGINAQPINAVVLNDQFRSAAANFSLDLFKATVSNNDNTLISPTSVLLALAMTANGADGNTLSQMERVLGDGMSIAELNAYLHSFVKDLVSLPKEHVSISNSIWFRDFGFTPNRDFLQTNANYFAADAFAAPFDNQTVIDINTWISEATDGLIEQMLSEIPQDAILYLINTILFDAEWEKPYNEESVRSGEFTNHNNQLQTAEFLHSPEFTHSMEYSYIQGNGATGFIKPYYSGRYSFAAILPDENIDILDYVATLSGEEFLSLIGNAYPARVMTVLPKFNYEYEILMNEMLIAMGMEDAFSRVAANLSRMGNAGGNLFISKVLHKANITVDERGTKAGAATVVEVSADSVPPSPDYAVILDRPFVYAILDNATNLPLFIGTFLSIP
jgi:serpin B